MEKIVLNACGIKSKGGITVLKNILKEANNIDFLIYDNHELEDYINGVEKLFIEYQDSWI